MFASSARPPGGQCPNIVTSDEGTSYCSLAEAAVRELQAERDHWRANHDNQVRIKREVSERLGNEIQRTRAMMEKIGSLEEELRKWSKATE